MKNERVKDTNSGTIQSRERILLMPKCASFLNKLTINLTKAVIIIPIDNTVVTGTLHIRHKKLYRAAILVVLSIHVPCSPESRKRANKTGIIGVNNTNSTDT